MGVFWRRGRNMLFLEEVFSLQCTVKEITYKIPISMCGPGESREKKTIITARRGYLMENRLRRLLRWEARTSNNDNPEERCEVDVPDEIIYVLLTPAYRSLSRPSSPDSSQASAIDLYSLGHIIFSALKLSTGIFVCVHFLTKQYTIPRLQAFLLVNASEDIPALTSVLPS